MIKQIKEAFEVGTPIYYIDSKRPGSPVFRGEVLSVSKIEGTAKVRVQSQHRDYPKDWFDLEVKLDILRVRKY